MSSPFPNALPDGIEIISKGIHSGLDPKLLADDQQFFAVNLTFRGGHATTRPNLVKIPLTFHDDEAHEDVETNATEARFQGAAFYESRGGRNCILASIGGRIFRYAINLTTADVSDLSIPGNPNNPTLETAWLFQGEEFMVINDGVDLPLFFDGSGMRRSANGNTELPVSCMGAYINGRFVVVLPDRRSYIAGDLVYSRASGTAAYGYRDAILKIKDNQEILQGAAFAIPWNAGEITAVFTTAMPDTSLGQGMVMIGTRKGIFTVDLPLDSTQWTTTKQPDSVIAVPSYGPTGQWSVVSVNSDAWYRSKDGIRSFMIARRDFNTWVQTALSFEMQAILPSDTKFLLHRCSTAEFDNRLLVTCSPYNVIDRGVAHRGLVALDFNNVSSLTVRSNPDYEGIWTGLNILQVIVGEFEGIDRCFLFALDADNKICLYELMPDINPRMFDNNGTEDVRVESFFISNAQFGRVSLPDNVRVKMKKLVCSDLYLSEMGGENLELSVEYRPDEYPIWQAWKDFEFCVPTCEVPTDCEQPAQIFPQYQTYVRLPEPPDTINAITERLMRTGYQFQFKIAWTGHCKLERMLDWAVPTGETVPSAPGRETCQLLKGCGTPFFTYSIEG